MQQYMCEFSIQMPSSDLEFLELLITEKNRIETIARSNIFQQVWLKNDKSGGYSIIEAEGVEDVYGKLHTLPLYRFMNFDIQPLAA